MFLFKRETMTTSTFRKKGCRNLLIGIMIIAFIALTLRVPYYRGEDLNWGHAIEPKSSGKQLSANNNSSYYRFQSGLVCWRNSTVANFKRNFLVTGCGYSATECRTGCRRRGTSVPGRRPFPSSTFFWPFGTRSRSSDRGPGRAGISIAVTVG